MLAKFSRVYRMAPIVALVTSLWILAGCGEEKPDSAPAVAPVGERVLVRHILIQYRGAEATTPEITLTRVQADSLVRALHTRLEAGERFDELAREYSDDASKAEGGEIAPLEPG